MQALRLARDVPARVIEVAEFISIASRNTQQAVGDRLFKIEGLLADTIRMGNQRPYRRIAALLLRDLATSERAGLRVTVTNSDTPPPPDDAG